MKPFINKMLRESLLNYLERFEFDEYRLTKGVREGFINEYVTGVKKIVGDVLIEKVVNSSTDNKDFIDWLSIKLGKRIGDSLGEGISGEVFDLGNAVIKLSNKNNLEQNTILNKNIPSVAKVFSSGIIKVPERFLEKFGGHKFLKLKNKEINVNNNKLYYTILEKVYHVNDVRNQIDDIVYALESYFDYKKEPSEVPVLRELFENRNNDSFIRDFAKFLRDEYVNSKSDYNKYIEILAELIGVFRNVGKYYDWMDIHAGQFGRNSKGELVAFDFDNPYEDTNNFIKHTVSESNNSNREKLGKLKNMKKFIKERLLESLMNERLTDVNEDVDFIYNLGFKNDVNKLNETGVLTDDMFNPMETSTKYLKSEESVKAHKLNPCRILINHGGNYYKPSNHIISVSVHTGAKELIISQGGVLSETNSVFKVEKIGEFDNQEDSILDYLNSDEEAYEKAKEAGFIIDKDGVIVGLGDIKMVDIDPNELY